MPSAPCRQLRRSGSYLEYGARGITLPIPLQRARRIPRVRFRRVKTRRYFMGRGSATWLSVDPRELDHDAGHYPWVTSHSQHSDWLKRVSEVALGKIIKHTFSSDG